MIHCLIFYNYGAKRCLFVYCFVFKTVYNFLYTALYLKRCTISLQRYYAAFYSKKATMFVPVSFTRCGISKIIPAVLRKHVTAKYDHGDYLIRICLSWFNFFTWLWSTCVDVALTWHWWGAHVMHFSLWDWYCNVRVGLNSLVSC